MEVSQGETLSQSSAKGRAWCTAQPSHVTRRIVSFCWDPSCGLESLHLSLLPRPLLSKENTLARKGLWVVTSDWAVLLTWPVTQRNRFLCNNCRGILSLTWGQAQLWNIETFGMAMWLSSQGSPILGGFTTPSLYLFCLTRTCYTKSLMSSSPIHVLLFWGG